MADPKDTDIKGKDTDKEPKGRLVRVALCGGKATDHEGVVHEFPDCNREGFLVAPDTAKGWIESGVAVEFKDYLST